MLCWYLVASSWVKLKGYFENHTKHISIFKMRYTIGIKRTDSIIRRKTCGNEIKIYS